MQSPTYTTQPADQEPRQTRRLRTRSQTSDLTGSHLFLPVAIEMAGTWNQMAVELVQEIGKRITMITEDTRETAFLFQRLSIALQRGNVVSFLSTFIAIE